MHDSLKPGVLACQLASSLENLGPRHTGEKVIFPSPSVFLNTSVLRKQLSGCGGTGL